MVIATTKHPIQGLITNKIEYGRSSSTNVMTTAVITTAGRYFDTSWSFVGECERFFMSCLLIVILFMFVI